MRTKTPPRPAIQWHAGAWSRKISAKERSLRLSSTMGHNTMAGFYKLSKGAASAHLYRAASARTADRRRVVPATVPVEGLSGRGTGTAFAPGRRGAGGLPLAVPLPPAFCAHVRRNASRIPHPPSHRSGQTTAGARVPASYGSLPGGGLRKPGLVQYSLSQPGGALAFGVSARTAEAFSGPRPRHPSNGAGLLPGTLGRTTVLTPTPQFAIL